MVNLGHQRKPISIQALDNVELPQRLGAVELLRHDDADQGAQLVEGTGLWQAVVADVVIDVEVLVIDPSWMALQRNPRQTLPVSRNQVQLGFDQSADTFGVDAALRITHGGGFEDGNPGDVHVSRPGLQRQKRVIEI